MPNKIALIDLYTDVNFRYSFNSCIGENEGYRYIVEINEDIVASNEIDGEFLIGKATRHLFLLGNAINDGYNITSIPQLRQKFQSIAAKTPQFRNSVNSFRA